MKKLFKLLLILFTLFSLSGCYNYKEINEYAIVSGISIDTDEKNEDKYRVGIQIMNAKKEEEADNSLITFYEASGYTIYESLEKILLDSPKELYLGHNEVIVISEDLLRKKDPLNYLDYFLRDSKVEKDALVMVAKKDKASDVLKIITPLETIPSKNLKSTIDIANKFSGSLTLVTLDEFISMLSNNGRQAILPTISIKGDTNDGEKMENISSSNPKTKLKFNSLAYFKNNKLKGYLTNDEATGYNFLANTQNKTYINIKCDKKNYATIKITGSKIKERLDFKNNKPIVNIDSKLTSNLLEYNCPADFLKNEKYIKNLEKKAENKITKLMKKATKKLYQEESTDVLNYGNKFFGKKYKEMKKLNYSKSDIANNVKFNYNVEMKIDSVELSIKSVKEDNSYE